MRKIRRAELRSLLTRNACEIFFIRRRPERAPGRPYFRNMLCSNSMQLLRSENGIRNLNFRSPRGPKKVDERKHNLLVVWDIFMQDYRNVSMDDCYVIQTIPHDDTFWKYYNDVLLKMGSSEKLRYMDSLGELPKPKR